MWWSWIWIYNVVLLLLLPFVANINTSNFDYMHQSNTCISKHFFQLDFIQHVLPNYMLVALHASIPPKSFFFDSQAFLCLPIFHGPPNVVKAAGAKRSAVIRTRACQAQPTRHCPWRGWSDTNLCQEKQFQWSDQRCRSRCPTCYS